MYQETQFLKTIAIKWQMYDMFILQSEFFGEHL